MGALTDPGQAFAAGQVAGISAAADHLAEQFPDLDDPEFGGPIRELRDMARRWEANPLPAAATTASPVPEHGTCSDPEKHKAAGTYLDGRCRSCGFGS